MASKQTKGTVEFPKKSRKADASVKKSQTASDTKEKSQTSETDEFIEKRRAAMAKSKEVRDEVVIVLTALLVILLYLSIFNACGKVGEWISIVLFGLLGGILPYIFPVALFGMVWYVRHNPDDPLAVRKTTVFGISQVFLAALVHIISNVAADEKFLSSFKVGYAEKRGGGFLGACVAEPLYGLFGKPASIIILVALLLVCIIVIIGKGLFRLIKKYIEEKREESREAYEEEPAPGADTKTMTLEQIQEANRKRRVTMVDVDAPVAPVDLSFYGVEQAPEPPKKKPGFFDRIRKKTPEPSPAPVYMAVFSEDGSKIGYIDPKAAKVIEQGIPGAPTPAQNNTPAANASSQYAPDSIGRNSKVSASGHPFYQIELDNKFRETNTSGGSILKDNYESAGTPGSSVSEKEAARRAAVERRLNAGNVSQIPIQGLSDNTDATAGPSASAQTQTPAASANTSANASYNPYDAVEPDEAVAPSREEMQSGGLRLVKGGESHSARHEQVSTQGARPTSSQTSSAGAGSEEKEAGEDAPLAQIVAPVREYRFPPIDLLKRPSAKSAGMSGDQLKATAAKLQNTLQSFGVNVTVTNISCGPSVTRYELTPEQGVKVSRITSLENDIKLNLAAEDIRIEAPIPGKAAVGIEVPNTEASGVMLRTLIESPEFKNNKGKITFAVGKDIGGNIVLSDIAKMPHLLIAGATGSGKSVCINTMIISLLYKYKPEDLRLIMVDPKVVELSVYNGIPHLLIPVVTDPRKASNALNWAVAEMTHRYELFAQQGVRNLEGFNEKIEASLVPLFDDKNNVLRKMPQIVIIVDELADLMMVAPGEVEDAICRLAQLARAAGIHLIIATQRPSVDVITGLIKANIPSRIAFAVSSGIDSRTILDQVGAEKLLGKGDMLFFPQGIPKPVRLQGPYVSDEEIAGIVEYLTRNNSVNYDAKASEDIANNDVATVSEQMKGGDSGPGDGRDEFFAQAGRFIIEKDKASIGMLQRVYKIGFNRAARIMDQLSEAGVVGPEEGTKPRKILMSAAEFEAFLAEQGRQ